MEEDAPASKNGLKSRDIIEEIDGEETTVRGGDGPHDACGGGRLGVGVARLIESTTSVDVIEPF